MTGYRGKRRTVLIIDDKEHNCLLLLNLLEPLGFSIIQAENGQKGVEKALANRPNLILTDLVMPVMTGFEAIKKLRQLLETKEISIIAVSASVLERAHHRLLNCDFLPKPIDEQQLFALIAKHLALEWEFGEKTEISEDTVEIPTTESDSLPVLPAEILEELYHLAVSGKMRDIREKATQLSEMDVQYQAIASKLHELAVQYELAVQFEDE